MTEMPAKTAKPIGRTDNDVPGSLNGGALDAAESAAEVPEADVEDEVDDGWPCVLGLPPAPLAGVTVEASVDEVAEEVTGDDDVVSEELVDEDSAADVVEDTSVVDDVWMRLLRCRVHCQ